MATTTSVRHEIEYRARKIQLTADWKFFVSGKGFELGKDGYIGAFKYESMALARDAIDAKIRVLEKIKKTSEKLALEAYDDEGKPVIVRGVHQNTGELLGCDSDAFPRVEWIGKLLKERKALSDRVHTISQVLRTVRIKKNRSFGRVFDNQYDQLIIDLKKDFAHSNAEAEKVGKVEGAG